MKPKRMIPKVLLALLTGAVGLAAAETLPPLLNDAAPATVQDLWAGFDPRSEPLDTELLQEWEEDGVVLRVLRYRIGVFKGRKAMMAAVYGFPKGARNLPGLVQIHGGGQFADHKAVLTNAKRGYATLSIAWAGRISAPKYRVGPGEVKLFWDGKTEDPNYRLTTDWGALDAYHAPSRNGKDAFVTIRDGSESWTLDGVPSPRNSSWFLCTLGARRALTFLERQPEVDPEKLGVYGHSMGGKLTVLTTGADERVKAAAPSCGGVSDRYNDNPLQRATIGDAAYLRRIRCPVLFLSPANDFHGRIDDLQTALTEIRSPNWRVTCAPHHNHQDTDAYEVATQLWFDQHLKGSFTCPETPRTGLSLKTANGTPSISVRPDPSKPILQVNVFYTQQGQIDGQKNDMANTKARFWHFAPATNKGGIWTATLPLFSTAKPLWVYANVVSPLDPPISGAGYYYGSYTADRFNLSSRMTMVTPEELQATGVKPALKPSLMIEPFAAGWELEWFTYKPEDWARRTHKLYHPRWTAPENARLAIDVRAGQPNKLVVGIDEHAAEITLTGGSEWQAVNLSLADFKDANNDPLIDWTGLKELRLQAAEHLKSGRRGQQTTRLVGANWKGAAPEFRNLRWTENH